MKRRKTTHLPHYRVYTRIKPSKLHGVGVFAITAIKKDSPIFYNDDAKIVWVNRRELKGLPREIRRLYEDFCTQKDKGNLYGCPKNFNLMTIAWYVNHSRRPNVYCSKDYNFYALRGIKPGEELTVDYNTYNDYARVRRTLKPLNRE
jgi:SET domain-containing protein